MIYSSWDIAQDILKLVILGHLLPFHPHKNPKICWRDHHFTHVYKKSQSYDVRVLRYRVRQAEFFVILGHFLSFYLPMDPENQNFRKMNCISEDIIILQMCTINDNHMMNSSWDMKHCGQNILSFWTVFCHFTSLTTWKIEILKNWKKNTWR